MAKRDNSLCWQFGMFDWGGMCFVPEGPPETQTDRSSAAFKIWYLKLPKSSQQMR